ncbi:hypothetical protein QJS10_CPB04g00782 [Acorus calamus]|uniref:Uncharacterized protein n=1 Tax=Acorus calamus TaxID=4465 RepID=A0AAV9EZT6_ACOCL|nr:hypothetical protein QJS10_CPB04g00782 [Acorus calamus]
MITLTITYFTNITGEGELKNYDEIPSLNTDALSGASDEGGGARDATECENHGLPSVDAEAGAQGAQGLAVVEALYRSHLRNNNNNGRRDR